MAKGVYVGRTLSEAAADDLLCSSCDEDSFSTCCGSRREYYSGCGGLSRSFRRLGEVTEEFDAFREGEFDPQQDLSDAAIIDGQIDEARRGLVRSAHFGLLCRSWCKMTMQYNQGTRTKSNPQGDGILKREVEGNRQLAEAFRLMVVLRELTIPFTLENPHDSFLWYSNEIAELRSWPEWNEVMFDQCMYKLRPPDWDRVADIRVRKRTKIGGTLANLKSLRRICDGCHHHSIAFGSVRVNGKRIVRAKAAGAYPACLCRALASLYVGPQCS